MNTRKLKENATKKTFSNRTTMTRTRGESPEYVAQSHDEKKSHDENVAQKRYGLIPTSAYTGARGSLTLGRVALFADTQRS